jgi:hypothetical protein
MGKHFFVESITALAETITTAVGIVPQIPAYDLPLDVSQITNWEEFNRKVKLSPQAVDLLAQNGFVVIETPQDIASQEGYVYSLKTNASDNFGLYYYATQGKDLPPFITSDTLLHYYHIFFDATLMKLENGLFTADLEVISHQLLNEALLEYQGSRGDLQEAARRNLAYLSVAMKLLDPSFAVPDAVQEVVNEEVGLIQAHAGWSNSPLFLYREDYSQYVPRGHYSESEPMKRYFQALVWFGRMTALLKGSDAIPPGTSQSSASLDGIISAEDARIQTLQANLLAYGFLIHPEVQEKWSRMYVITSFLVGVSDDLGPFEYAEMLLQLLGSDLTPQTISDRIVEIQADQQKLLYQPRIYGGLGGLELVAPPPPLTSEQLQQLKTQAQALLDETKGFRLMGQRFTLDSWLFSQIVSPYSGLYTGDPSPLPTRQTPFTFLWNDPLALDGQNRPFTWVKTENGREVRGFPTGLDLMALLGSNCALEILKGQGDAAYSDYTRVFDELKGEMNDLTPQDWLGSVYMNWLSSLQPLLAPVGEGYPTFMQTSAWQKKQLNTALASWTELRHDTQLYVKSSYSVSEKGGPLPPQEPFVGYVEPVAEFYARLQMLADMTLICLQILPTKELNELQLEYPFRALSSRAHWLLQISRKELENQPLQDLDLYGVKYFADSLAELTKTLLMSNQDLDLNTFRSTLVSDVHTDGNSRMALEEATGNLRSLVAAVMVPDGRIFLSIGPVMSYYEFKQPIAQRLTDAAWRAMLNGEHPHLPAWTKDYSE